MNAITLPAPGTPVAPATPPATQAPATQKKWFVGFDYQDYQNGNHRGTVFIEAASEDEVRAAFKAHKDVERINNICISRAT